MENKKSIIRLKRESR